ncbi:BTAD domain-containing putative transcriptional regulator [Nonomuraea sp. MCN248]|uniref:BTAD domain-containing putative transcriptional regulator n=1 Tax=Nonomuraea corallina TaxID=2989783 RepID=A0ABT4SDM0_9ACTN|nr:BTAD domain-containing putative transcriptional regulator [Nonomuraea corallina]MDA0635302.1 BTAD domain-containing putative transcriptional regulator [Nonomuraea corallina]
MPGPAQHARGRRPARAPARIPGRRRLGDVLAGLGALALLLALVGGVPYALLVFVGPPIGPELLDLDLLTARVGPSTITALLVLFVWLAWLQLFACVVVEVYAGVRRVGMPARVPLSGGTQVLANKLVTAALVLFTAGAAVAPIARLAGPPPTMPPVTAVAFTAPVVEQQVVDNQRTKKVYVVQPPHGRHHESLWEIAEKCLGDGRRYPEIFRLNQHKEQPDGSRLRMADLIRPGWVLDMPDDARNTHLVPANQARAQTLKEHPGPPKKDRPADVGQRQGDQGKGDQGKSEQRKGDQGKSEQRSGDQRERGSGDQRQGERGSGDRTGADQNDGRHADGSALLDVLSGASLAAAGLLALLAVRRREQLWRRLTGHRVARPQGDAADAEVALRLGADKPGARILDLGLRLLGAELGARGRTPPTVYAAHLSARSLDLWVHPPDEHPPAPWTADDGGQVWRLAAQEGRLLDDQRGGAPYPGLVSIGTDRSGRVLVDLEAAQGLINIRGPQTTAALAALAVELATNRWSDRMRVTLVGFGEELTAIAPDRVRAVGGLAEVLPELEASASPRREVLTGRITGRPGVAHYLLSAVAPTHDEARRLALLARNDSAGYVVAGDVPHATWTWEITEDGLAKLPELGFEVRAQLLPRRHYRALVELFRTADRVDGERIPVPEPLTDLRPPAVEIRILGPVEVVGPRPLEEGRMALAAELLVYLATHPGGVHPVVLGGVLWPRGVQPMVRDATIARVVSWLGREHLRADESGRLSLGPGVRTDWALFRELVRRSHGDQLARTVLLEKALGLIRGPLLTGRPPGRYAWLAADALEYDVVAEVADAARRLCEIRLAEGEPDAAIAAVRAALLLAADDESLWRDLLRAAHATGDLARLRAVIAWLTRRAAGGLAPETEALIDELLPSWRVHLVRESTA